MSRWFRFYAEAMRNPKVMRLSDRDFRLWVKLLAVASERDGHIPALDDLKLLLNTRLDHLSTGVERLISGGLIDALGDGYEPHNWAKFQYKSDTSRERVAKHRAACNVTVTPPDTETETDTETESKKEKKERRAKPASRAQRCHADWQPKPLSPDLAADVAQMPPGWIERQLAAMKDWSASSPKGAKVDWDAAWRGWVRRSMEGQGNGNMGRSNGGDHAPQYRKQPGWDAFKRLRDEHLAGIDEAGADEGTRSGDDRICYPLALSQRH